MISSFATLFNTFFTAIIYLESQQKIHRDISYTNVLLREPGHNSLDMEENRKQVMKELGLAEIEIQRHKLKCREGLLIDFDYGGEVAVAQSQKETERNQPQTTQEDEQEQAREQQDGEDDGDDGEGSTIGHCANEVDSGVRTVGPF